MYDGLKHFSDVALEVVSSVGCPKGIFEVFRSVFGVSLLWGICNSKKSIW